MGRKGKGLRKLRKVIFIYLFFFFNDTATTEIYTLSLHDALPILPQREPGQYKKWGAAAARSGHYKKQGALLQRELVSIKSGALPQQEKGSIKSRGAAATKTGQYK